MQKVLTYILAALVGIAFFAGTATAATAALPADTSISDLARPIYDAIMHGQYWAALALGLVLITAVLKRYAAPKLPWLTGDVGAPTLVLLASFGAASATAFLAGAAPSLALAWASAQIAFVAAGGFALAKKLFAPLLGRLSAKAPAWLRPIIAAVLWVFDRPSAIAKAEKSGAAALVKDPPKGVVGVIGKPEDLK